MGRLGYYVAGAGEPCLCVQTWFPTKKESEDDCNEEKIKNREPGRPGADADDDEYLSLMGSTMARYVTEVTEARRLRWRRGVLRRMVKIP